MVGDTVELVYKQNKQNKQNNKQTNGVRCNGFKNKNKIKYLKRVRV